MMSWRLIECSLEQEDYGTNTLHSEEQHGNPGRTGCIIFISSHILVYLFYCLRFATNVLGGLYVLFYLGAPFHLVVGGKAAALLCSIYPMRETWRLGCWSDMGCFFAPATGEEALHIFSTEGGA